jgi:hypothetical protein
MLVRKKKSNKVTEEIPEVKSKEEVKVNSMFETLDKNLVCKLMAKGIMLNTVRNSPLGKVYVFNSDDKTIKEALLTIR